MLQQYHKTESPIGLRGKIAIQKSLVSRFHTFSTRPTCRTHHSAWKMPLDKQGRGTKDPLFTVCHPSCHFSGLYTSSVGAGVNSPCCTPLGFLPEVRKQMIITRTDANLFILLKHPIVYVKADFHYKNWCQYVHSSKTPHSIRYLLKDAKYVNQHKKIGNQAIPRCKRCWLTQNQHKPVHFSKIPYDRSKLFSPKCAKLHAKQRCRKHQLTWKLPLLLKGRGVEAINQLRNKPYGSCYPLFNSPNFFRREILQQYQYTDSSIGFRGITAKERVWFPDFVDPFTRLACRSHHSVWKMSLVNQGRGAEADDH